ncbi:MAG: Crp/Fnr family transcriptional regulator [Rhodospirillaceae bacterium]|nr:Crp/Fnr family transcriptional regulator [Rhodospirillaceae bacterium]
MAASELQIAQKRQGVDVGSPCAACSIREMSICAALDNSELSRMAAIARTQSFAGRQTIVDEGEPADSLFNITSGAVKLYKLLPDGRRQITGFLFEGDFLGIALNDDYAYTAEAVNDVTLCRFPTARFEALLEEFPKLEKQLLEVASNELAQAQDQMLLLGRKTAQEKVVSFLLSLSKRSHARGAPASPISLPMSRADIADYLGLTTETVSRTFTSLKGSDAIRLLAGNSVALENFESLSELADGI